MVQAILENRKTMTRRTKGLEYINESPDNFRYDRINDENDSYKECYFFEYINTKYPPETYAFVEPVMNVGDILWVRETWQIRDSRKPNEIFYRADDDMTCAPWKPSIFMPKQACRIFLKIKSIKVERLQDISPNDIIKEGVLIPVSNKSEGNNKVVFELEKDNSALSFLPNGCMNANAPKLNQNQLLNAFWAELWCKINGRNSWNSNPFVFVYEFERIEKPLDFA